MENRWQCKQTSSEANKRRQRNKQFITTRYCTKCEKTRVDIYLFLGLHFLINTLIGHKTSQLFRVFSNCTMMQEIYIFLYKCIIVCLTRMLSKDQWLVKILFFHFQNSLHCIMKFLHFFLSSMWWKNFVLFVIFIKQYCRSFSLNKYMIQTSWEQRK